MALLKSLPEIQAYLSTLKYRDWKFEILEPREIRILMAISFEAEDADAAFAGQEPRKARPSLTCALPFYNGDTIDTEQLKNHLWYIVKAMVLHEAGEWFTIGGERPFHPHTRKEPTYANYLQRPAAPRPDFFAPGHNPERRPPSLW